MSLKAQKIFAVILLFASFMVFYLMVLSLDNSQTYLFDLHPEPDAMEYFAGGVSLARENGYAIHVAGLNLPPRYPFGYSLLMVPALRAGVEPITVPFLVNRIFAAGLLVALFATLWTHQLYLAAGLAPLMMSTQPAFIILARSPMSEVSGAFFLFLGGASLVAYCTSGFRRTGAVGALFLGVSVWFRILNLPLAGLMLALAPLLGCPGVPRKRFLDLVIFLKSFLIALVPLVLYQYMVFGSPFRTGYHLWTTIGEETSSFFSIRFLPENLMYLFQEVTQSEEGYTVADLCGEGSYFGPVLLVLLLVTLFTFRRHPIFHLLALVAGAYTGLLVIYRFQDARLFFPLFIMAVTGAAQALPVLWSRASWPARCALLLVLLCQLSIFPGRRLDPDFERYLRARTLHSRPAGGYLLVRKFCELRDPGPTLILTDMNMPYVYALTDGVRAVLPLTSEHEYRFVREVDVSSERLRSSFESRVAEGWGIYAIVNRGPVKSLEKHWPAPEGFEWSVKMLEGIAGGGIAKLERLDRAPRKCTPSDPSPA